MPLENRITSTVFRDSLQKVKTFSKTCLPYTHMHGYKAHGYEHSLNIKALLEELLGSFSSFRDTLSERDIYILLTSCYLLDIGLLIVSGEEYRTALSQHNNNNVAYLEKYAAQIGIVEEEVRNIQDVCYGFKNYVDEHEVTIDTIENETHRASHKVRSVNQKLAALIRICYHFDLKNNSQTFIPKNIFFQKVDHPDRYEWLLREKIASVRFRGGGVVDLDCRWNTNLNVTILDLYRIKVMLLDKVNALQIEINKCNRYLSPNVSLNRINANIEEFTDILSPNIHRIVASVKKAITLTQQWLFSLMDPNSAWGKVKQSRPRVTNSAKAIIGLLDYNKSSSNIDLYQKEKILAGFEWIMTEFDDAKGGFPAKTITEHSTSANHCSAMVVYVFAILFKLGLLSDSSSTDYFDKIKRTIKWLLDTKLEVGWGNWEDQPFRALCTYWTLRALNQMQEIGPIVEELEMLKQIDFKQDLKEFGTFLKDPKHNNLTSACFFLILYHETGIQDSEELEGIARRCIVKIYEKRNEKGYWIDEKESYDLYDTNGKVTLALDWTHHIAALALHALAVNKEHLRPKEIQLFYESVLAMVNNQKTEGNFEFIPNNFRNLVTPTYESLNALNKVLEVLNT